MSMRLLAYFGQYLSVQLTQGFIITAVSDYDLSKIKTVDIATLTSHVNIHGHCR